MAKPNHAQEQTMEEILATIRRMISDEEARRPTGGDGDPPEAPPFSLGNVSRLFAEPPRLVVAGASAAAHGPDEPLGGEDIVEAEVVDEERAQDEADSETPATAAGPVEMPLLPPPSHIGTVVEADADYGLAEALHDPPANEDRRAEPLLSPGPDEAVAAAFDRLTQTMLMNGAHTVDELVEDMLRPMLREWLDDNLPPLVERMVREEIERVSRGRR